MLPSSKVSRSHGERSRGSGSLGLLCQANLLTSPLELISVLGFTLCLCFARLIPFSPVALRMRKHPFIPSSVRRGPLHRASLSEFGRGQSWLRLHVSSAAGLESIRGLLRAETDREALEKKEEKKTRSERGDISLTGGPRRDFPLQGFIMVTR